MTWGNRVRGISVGDTVRYSRQWLQSVQADAELARAKGVVTAIKDYGSTKVATVDWGSEDIPERVNLANLSKVKLRGRE